MTSHQQWGVMHPNGTMIDEPQAGYPFRSRRMAEALARDLDDDCECGGVHDVMVRDVSEWRTLTAADYNREAARRLNLPDGRYPIPASEYLNNALDAMQEADRER